MAGEDHRGADDVRATQPLREEWAAVEPVLSGIAALIGRIRRGEHVHPLRLAGALTCLDAFQRCHDQKVEAVLLPALRGRAGAPDPEAVGAMVAEHEETRRCVESLRRLLEGSRGLNEAICRSAEECATLLQSHARREQEGLLEAADRVLSIGETASLLQLFRGIDDQEVRPGERQALRALADAVAPAQEPSATRGHVAGIVAAHVMRPRPRAVRPVDTLASAAELMGRVGVRELPVVADGRLCGIVARVDLEAHFGHLEWTGVEAAMTPEPVVVTPEQPATAVSRVLLRGQFNAVPVIADEATLVGMVSRSDLLRAVADHAGVDGR